MTIEISLAEGVQAVEEGAWDALVSPDDSPFVRHAFLAGLEETGCVGGELGWLPRPLLVHDGDRLVAAAPLYVKGNSEGEFVFDHGIHRFAERIGVRYLPKLLVGVPFTPATGPRVLARPAERDALRPLVAKALVAVARETKASSVHVNFVREDEQRALADAGFLAREGVQFHFENRGYGTFDDFLATFSAKRRHQIRRERREVAAAGVTVRTLRGRELSDAHLDVAYAFYLATVDRFRPWTRDYLTRAFFAAMRDRLGEALEIVFAEREAKPIACAVNLTDGTRLYGRYWGQDPEVTVPFLHFEVCYYHSIDDVIRRGLSAFEPGAGGEHKLPRGFVPTRTRSAHHFASPKLREAVATYFDEERAAIRRELEGGED